MAPNEDGFGTSAWAVRLAKELARQSKDKALGIEVVVSTDRHRAFQQDRRVEIVRLDGIRNRVELVKNRGGVEVAGSLARCVRSYGRSRAEYRRARSFLQRFWLTTNRFFIYWKRERVTGKRSLPELNGSCS